MMHRGSEIEILWPKSMREMDLMQVNQGFTLYFSQIFAMFDDDFRSTFWYAQL